MPLISSLCDRSKSLMNLADSLIDLMASSSFIEEYKMFFPLEVKQLAVFNQSPRYACIPIFSQMTARSTAVSERDEGEFPISVIVVFPVFNNFTIAAWVKISLSCLVAAFPNSGKYSKRLDP